MFHISKSSLYLEIKLKSTPGDLSYITKDGQCRQFEGNVELSLGGSQPDDQIKPVGMF